MTSAASAAGQYCDIRLSPTHFRLLRDLIYRLTGISLADNKLEFVRSRLRKRLRALGIDSYGKYFEYVRAEGDNGPELQELINRVTTNKTSFFREEHHFDLLKEELIPRIITEAKAGRRPKKLRIWCAAASTGEEPYSLAMTVRDALEDRPGWDVRILASDIDTGVLETAQSAIYSADIADDISSDSLNRHFIRSGSADGNRFLVRPETAQLVTFRQLNLLQAPWPIHVQFDAIFCRNVLIYFDHETHDRVMRNMADYLAPDGHLFIGHSESLTRLSDVYTRTGKTVYRHATRIPAAQAAPVQRPAEVREVKVPQKSIIIGDVEASSVPLQVSTVLGSCIAVCLYDEQARVGGMNHFALPSGSSESRVAASFGVHAMELLINQIMQLGGDRRRLTAKMFGGARLISGEGTSCIGERNSDFVREFLSLEGIPLVAEFVGGDMGMQVLFECVSGRARVRTLDRNTVQKAESERKAEAEPAAASSDITLF